MKSSSELITDMVVSRFELVISQKISEALELIGKSDVEELKSMSERLSDIRRMILHIEGTFYPTQGLTDLHNLLNDVIGCYMRKVAIHHRASPLELVFPGQEKHELIWSEKSFKHSIQYWVLGSWSEWHFLKEEFHISDVG